MQKKLITAAVGGALAVIGATPALAQNATVNVFGTFYGEYSRINNGNKTAGEPYQTYDHFQNPGSEIGFRGEEKLGGGLSAWFQCTSSIDYRGSGSASSSNAQAGSTWCTRNSALGMKGVFGNVFYGNWQTPWTRINSAGNTGSNDTGVFGNAHIIAGTSSTFGISSASGTTNTVSPGVFRRRQNSMFTYETPSFAGFQAMGSVTTRNYASAATSAQLKSRLWSVGAQYANGPIFAGAAYEKHDKFIDHGAGNAGDVDSWTIAATYTLPINLKLGGSYQKFKSETTATATSKVSTWHVGIDWMISGPHGIRAAYSRAGEMKGPVGTTFNTRPTVNAAGGTAADMWQIRYVHALSKRTELTAGYSRVNQRTNANGYEVGGSSTTQAAGSDSNAFAVGMQHRF